MKYRALSVAVSLFLFTSISFAQFGDAPLAPSLGRNGQFGQTISGVVVTINGHPVQNARIEIHDANSGSIIASSYSLPGGTFAIDNIPPGHYEVLATVGLQEARQRVDMSNVGKDVTLRMAGPSRQTDGGVTVSVGELQVPRKAKKEYENAEKAFNKQKMDEARKHVAKALKVDPTYSRALSLKALLDVMDNHLSEAVTDAEAAVHSDSSYGMGYVILGAIYNTVQRYNDAERVLDRAMPLVPNAWQAHFELSRALLGQGDYHHALMEVDRALQSAPPKYAPAHLVRAHALLGLKAYNDAVAELEKCIGEDPTGVNSVEARRTLGQVKAFMATASK